MTFRTHVMSMTNHDGPPDPCPPRFRKIVCFPKSCNSNTVFILHSLAMAPGLVHLPNGQTMAVSPIYGGLSFKANDLNIHHSIFPPGWTIILETEDGDNELEDNNLVNSHQKYHTHRYRAPTLNQDNLFISSISNPSNTDFKPATSPTRQTAMMLWATLWWYFHQVPCWAALVEL